jgi:hypothetical protein
MSIFLIKTYTHILVQCFPLKMFKNNLTDVIQNVNNYIK